MGTFLAIASTLIPAVIGIVQAVRQDQEQKRQNALQANMAKQSLDLNKENLDLNKEVSQQNYELQKEQFEYQKQLNDTVMQREDTAMQRQVADLQAAGLSPLMVSGGASATPLTSSNAPQRDLSGMNQAMSGINTATGNMMSAYNDIFNRKMQKQQFQLQAITSMSQMYTNLLESRLNQKKLGLENQILELDKKYYESHPERNLGFQSVLTNLVSSFLHSNPSAVNTLKSIGTDVSNSNPLGYSGGTNNVAGNNLASNMLQALKNPRSIAGNLDISIPSLKKSKVVDSSTLKKDTDFLQEQQNKNYKLALNAVETRANKKDEKLLKAIDFLWNNSTANDYFIDKESFKNKVLNDSSYRKNIAKNLKLKAYKNPFKY